VGAWDGMGQGDDGGRGDGLAHSSSQWQTQRRGEFKRGLIRRSRGAYGRGCEGCIESWFECKKTGVCRENRVVREVNFKPAIMKSIGWPSNRCPS